MKTIILGSSNPYKSPPLWPDPPGCAGWNLWRMSGMTREDYLDKFEFRNLFASVEEEASAMHDRAVRKTIGNKFAVEMSQDRRTVLILGGIARTAIGLASQIIHPCRHGAAVYYQIPHPSGRNTFYNDPVCRDLIRLLLEDLP
jgi:hypothetical protein